MKRLMFMTVAAFGLGTPLLAQTLPEIADTDANGTWSLVELQAAWPDLTDEVYVKVDVNADGGVDQAELTTALAEGVLKPIG